MSTKAFKEIDFTLPKKDRLKIASQIETACGNAWYEKEGDRPLLDNHYRLDGIEGWSFRVKET